MLLFLLVGLLLLRFAARQLIALLFQLPPRFTRFEPFGCHPKSLQNLPPIRPALRRHLSHIPCEVSAMRNDGKIGGPAIPKGLCPPAQGCRVREATLG